jgi:hypothetical protein
VFLERRRAHPPPPKLWFGMIGRKEAKWITSDPDEAQKAASKTYCRIHQVFHTQEEAEEWLEESDDDKIPELIPRKHQAYYSDSSEDDDSVPEVDVRGIAKADRRKKKNQARRARKKEAEKKKRKQKETAKGKKNPKPTDRNSHKHDRGHKKRHGGSDDESDPSDSSSESESDSSESGDSTSSSSSSNGTSSSSSSSSNSSSAPKRPNRRTGNKKSKKSKGHKNQKKKGKGDNYHKFQHDDPSTGDPQRIYGMSINGVKIDEAVAPNSMRRTDRGSMYNACVDVTSLPGGWNSNKGVSEELFNESQKIAQLTSTILASTNKVKGMEIQDTSWNSTIRHSLGKVKNREDLFEFVRKLRKSKKAAFKQEGNLIQHYLYQRHYNGTYIREYVRSSLLGVLSARSFRFFFDLADALRQLAFDHPHWEGGPALAMLRFHSEKLMEIRQFSVSRKQLILQVYTYLRDAQAKDFYHESMAGAIWERIGNLSSSPTPNGNGGGSPEATRCGLCNNKELHKLFNVPGQKSLCPLKGVARLKVKEAAQWVVDERRSDPSKDINALLSEAKVQFV